MEWILDPLNIAKSFSGIFFAIVFIQSGLDKIFNWKDNLDWLKGHFAKSFLKSSVSILLAVLTLVEISSGVLSLVGTVCLNYCQEEELLLTGISLSAIALLMLLLGQRIAKDYEGAKTIAIYFGIALVSLYAYF
jgi:hypothetical protein